MVFASPTHADVTVIPLAVPESADLVFAEEATTTHVSVILIAEAMTATTTEVIATNVTVIPIAVPESAVVLVFAESSAVQERLNAPVDMSAEMVFAAGTAPAQQVLNAPPTQDAFLVGAHVSSGTVNFGKVKHRYLHARQNADCKTAFHAIRKSVLI